MSYLERENWDTGKIGPHDALEREYGDIEIAERDDSIPDGLTKAESRKYLREHGVNPKR